MVQSFIAVESGVIRFFRVLDCAWSDIIPIAISRYFVCWIVCANLGVGMVGLFRSSTASRMQLHPYQNTLISSLN